MRLVDWRFVKDVNFLFQFAWMLSFHTTFVTPDFETSSYWRPSVSCYFILRNRQSRVYLGETVDLWQPAAEVSTSFSRCRADWLFFKLELSEEYMK